MSNLDEQLLQAEFVASHELTEDLGMWMEFADRVGRTAQEQLQIWLEDQQAFLRALGSGQPPLEAVAEHASRSSQHCAEGLQAATDLYAEQMRRMARLHEMLWSPLLGRSASR